MQYLSLTEDNRFDETGYYTGGYQPGLDFAAIAQSIVGGSLTLDDEEPRFLNIRDKTHEVDDFINDQMKSTSIDRHRDSIGVTASDMSEIMQNLDEDLIVNVDEESSSRGRRHDDDDEDQFPDYENPFEIISTNDDASLDVA